MSLPLEAQSKRHKADQEGGQEQNFPDLFEDLDDNLEDFDDVPLETPAGVVRVPSPERAALTRPKDKTDELRAAQSELATVQSRIAGVRENLRALKEGAAFPHPELSPESLLAVVDARARELNDLASSECLSIKAIYTVDSLRLMAAWLREQLLIFKHERDMLLTKEWVDPRKLVCLFFVSQPRAQPVKRRAKRPEKGASKQKKAQLVYEASLLCGAVTRYEPKLASVFPSLTILEDTRAKVLRGSQVNIEAVSVSWNQELSRVSVACAFPDGTQVLPSLVNIQLQGLFFGLDGGPQEIVISTCNPVPIVVTTNESQWEHAEGRLLRRRLFGDLPDENVANASVTVTWAQFSNSLMDFFMRATRQDLTDCSLQDPATSALFPNPQRELSNDDLAYIHERKFGGRPALRPAEFSEFWTWFGALSHQYRHNQTLRGMFLRGLIYGFVSKEQCVRVLKDLAPGTFLIRNSEHSAIGEFALAFVNAQHVVKHHKIDHKKLKPPFGNLADFVRGKEQLRLVVKCFHLDPKNGTVLQQRVAVPKGEAFADFFSLPAAPDAVDSGNYTAFL